MADFFPLISRAVSLLPDSATQADRDAIYNKARTALERQLRSVEPALNDDNIAKELNALEVSVLKVEESFIDKNLIKPEIEVTEASPSNEIFEELKYLAGEKNNEISKIEVVSIPDNDVTKTHERPQVKLENRTQVAQGTKKKNLIFAAGLPIIIGLMAVFGIISLNNKQSSSIPKTASTPLSSGVQTAEKPNESKPSIPLNSEVSISIPVAVRASLYEEDSTNPQMRIERRGAIVWRVETDGSDQSGQAIPRIRGNMEFPDAKLNAEIVLRRNLDASFPASHTIDVRFLATALDAKTVKGISLPEFRSDFQEKGPMLQAVKAPDIDNTFLIALLNTEPFQTTNIELLKKSGWLFFELRFADGKRGELVFEKGVAGENAFSEAFLAWKQ
jgi:hypothetical protein